MDYQYGQNDQNQNQEQQTLNNSTGQTTDQTTGQTSYQNQQTSEQSNPYSRNMTNGNTSYNNPGSSWNDEWGSSNRQNQYQNYYQAGQNPYSANNGSAGNNNRNNRHNRGWIAAMMAGVLVVGVAAGALFGSGFATNTSDVAMVETLEETESETVETEAEESKAELSQSSGSTDVATTATTTANGSAMSVEQIAANCLPSIVAITNKSETEIRSMWGEVYTQESDSAGSGVIIGETDTELLIVTNYHVIEGNESLSVLFSYQENVSEDEQEIATALVKDYDSSKDLAVIAVQKEDLSEETMANIKIATIGDSSSLVLGQQVVAIGNALGYGQSITVGYVSALNRSIELTQSDGTAVSNAYIQTDAAINPGNSGGGLFNMYGELVGINSAKVSLEEVEGMGYSIPISDVTGDIETMMNAETKVVVDEADRGYLGIQGSNVTSDINQTYG
ncbi:MAG: trypsin-like peptidase domain-containing protein, partial [Lachnospiraceae bacterium]|nr:trypsin-like peptidase domain-containing protein [Lachnospiraceae bacterium]